MTPTKLPTTAISLDGLKVLFAATLTCAQALNISIIPKFKDGQPIKGTDQIDFHSLGAAHLPDLAQGLIVFHDTIEHVANAHLLDLQEIYGSAMRNSDSEAAQLGFNDPALSQVKDIALRSICSQFSVSSPEAADLMQRYNVGPELFNTSIASSGPLTPPAEEQQPLTQPPVADKTTGAM